MVKKVTVSIDEIGSLISLGAKVGDVVEGRISGHPLGAFAIGRKITSIEGGKYHDENGVIPLQYSMIWRVVSRASEAPAEVIGANKRVIGLGEDEAASMDRLRDYIEALEPRSKYHRIIKGVELDIYDILVAWGVTCPARQHAIKKLFMAGQRGAKGVVQDLDEAIQAVERAKELVG